MICINCGEEIINIQLGCLHCGYKPLITDFICPNLIGTSCAFTGNVCTKGENFIFCDIKSKADKEAPF